MTLKSLILAMTACIAVAAAEPVQTFQLPNGLRVLLAENHERPLVRLELAIAWDPREEPAGKGGLGGYLAEVLSASGAGSLKRADFQQFLESRALKYSFTMRPDSFVWSVLAESQGQDEAFASLSLAAGRPVVDENVAEAVRQGLLQQFRERSSRSRAEARFRRSIADPSASQLPDEASLGRTTYGDLVTLSKRILRPEKSVLIIWGDLNLPQAKQMAALHLGAWGPSEQAPVLPATDQPLGPSKPVRTWLVREPGASIQVQTGGVLPSGEDWSEETRSLVGWLASRELSRAFPGFHTEFRWLSGRSWRMDANPGAGMSLAAAAEAMNALLAHLKESKLDPGTLTSARSVWGIEQQARNLHPEQMVDAMAVQALLGLRGRVGPDHPGLEGVQEAFHRMFSSERISYFITGADVADGPRLETLGLGPVETIY